MRDHSDSRYIFQKYTNRDSRKTCPRCGCKHSLTLYIDRITGKPVDSTVGRCDHEQSCGYDYTPQEFFKDNPWEREMKTGMLKRVVVNKTEYAPYMDSSLVPSKLSSDNSLFNWLSTFIPVEALNRVRDEYFIGSSIAGKDGTKGVIFWQIDFDGNVHDGKIMWYKSDGHRQNFMTWVSSKLKQVGKFPQLDTRKCLFGEHLLDDHPDKTIVLVESEKSAVICSALMPQYLWMATCGCGGLNIDKVRPLRGRRVIVIPDAGEKDRWDKILAYSMVNYTIIDFEQYPKNTDIVDIMLGEAGPRIGIEQLTSIINSKI